MEHGINANVVHSWRKRSRLGPVRSTQAADPSFVQLTLPAAPAAPLADMIEVEVQRGATLLKVRWPLAAAADLNQWTREVLR